MTSRYNHMNTPSLANCEEQNLRHRLEEYFGSTEDKYLLYHQVKK